MSYVQIRPLCLSVRIPFPPQDVGLGVLRRHYVEWGQFDEVVKVDKKIQDEFNWKLLDVFFALETAGELATLRSTLGRVSAKVVDDVALKISPLEINFSQRTVSANVEQYARNMKAGDWVWNTENRIRIIKQDGKWVSYDNRRLMAAQQAGLKEIPYEVVDPNAIMPGSKKTWAEAFQKRFNDSRNVDAGGVVPPGGLTTQPSIVQ